MKLKIIAVSDSDKHFSTAIQEYIKRMGKKLSIEHIRPVKYGNVQKIIERETDTIVQKLQKQSGYIVLLTKEGKQSTTEQLVKQLHGQSSVTIVVGGPYGMDEKRLAEYTNATLSFGLQTMPHGLAKLVVLEQLYRVQTLIDGKKYHY